MSYRFYAVLLMLISSGKAFAANNAAWNCQQNQTGEWTCLNDPAAASAKPSAKSQQPEPASQTSRTASSTAPGDSKTAQAKSQPEVEKLRVHVDDSGKVAVDKTNGSENKKQMASACSSANGKNNDGSCNQKAADKQVASNEVDSYLLTPTFDALQENHFRTLQAEFKENPWQNCSNWSARKRKLSATSQEIRDQANTDVDSDFSELFDSEILNFAGNVDLRRADQHLMADRASYDTVAETLDAQGNVLYSEDQVALFSHTASLSMGKDEARLRKALFVLPDAPMRGSADTIYRDSKFLSRYEEAAFTSCQPGNQDWVAHAERVKINRETGLGSAKHAWLEFKGVPFLYTPYISFPIDSRRTSGLLSPNFGNTQRSGFDTAIPYYWNIAPNYDMIITPRYMSKRGGMIRDQFRYLTKTSQGKLSGEIMPYDQLTDSQRYSGSWKDKTVFTPHLSSLIDLNYVSDKNYLNDLNNALGFQTNRYLPSLAYLNYARPDVSFSAGMQHYQLVDKSISFLPYDMLPRVDFNLGHRFEELPLQVALNNQYTHFYISDRPSDGSDTRKNGQRFNVMPSISAPLESSAGFVIPKASVAFTQYELDDPLSPNLSTSISRTLPIFSVDSGLMFEKDYGAESSSPFTHTLEPRAFYLYIPRKDQNNIPIFDTAPYDVNYQSLFFENRFSGYDRFQDANQVTLGGTSRIIDRNTGLEPIRASLGQIVYFQDREVTWTGRPETSTTSNFIGELSGQMSKSWSYLLGGQWNPELNSVSRHQAYLRYRQPSNLLFDVGYRYRKKDNLYAPQTISQTDLSFRLPVAAEWYALGRWQYSLNFDKTTESFIGVEKENCCWRFRFIARRYINGAQNSSGFSNVNTGAIGNVLDLSDPNIKPETAFFFQLELKGLTGLGSQIDTFLQQSLNGYRKDSYDD